MSEMKDKSQQVKDLYDIFDEDQRLASKAGRVEFLTTVHHIERHLKPGMKILDIGAGTGAYSIYFAKKGYQVTAVELVDKHVDQIRAKRETGMDLVVHQGNALDLSVLGEETFDVIFSFGPLYHIEDWSDRQAAIKEIKKHAKKETKVYYAFINNDMVITTERMNYNEDFFKGNSYDRDSFKLKNIPFVFHTLDGAYDLLRSCQVRVEKTVASDGLSELLADKINAMDDHDYQMWLKYHLYCSEKAEFLGTSNHFLVVGSFEGEV